MITRGVRLWLLAQQAGCLSDCSVDDGYLQWMLKTFPECGGKMKQQREELAGKVICSVHILLIDLKSCSTRRDLQWGRKIHAKAVESGHDSNMFVVTALSRMYAKCGSMVDARRMFDSIQEPDVVCWNVLLLGYAENGDGFTALELFSKMKTCGCWPNSVTFIAALKACTSLKQDQGECLRRGREIHSEIGHHMEIFLQSALIDMYGKCGSVIDARSVFETIENPNVVCWNALLLGYAENGDGLATLELFSRMKDSGCVPNSVTYMAALKACTALAGKRDGSGLDETLKRGREIHSEIGCNLNILVQSTLIDMYANCGSMVDACCVFDSIHKPDVVCWNALLLGYAENGDGLTTLDLFSKMKASGGVPNSLTYVAALKACGIIGALARGRQFHMEIKEFTTHVVTSLVDFYAKCGSIIEARQVFDAHPRARNVATWTALLTGFGTFGDIDSVFNLFEAMQDQGFQPNDVTFVCMLSCCSHAGLIEKAKEYFEAMPTQYGVTRTVTHYTCMVDVLGRANQLDEAIGLVRKMPCKADAVIWMTLLGACRKWKNAEIGRCAFQSLVDMDKKNAPAYVLMSHICSDQERIKLRSSKLHREAYVYDEVGNMVKFVVGEEDHPDIKNKIEQGIKEQSYVAELYYNSIHNVGDAEEEQEQQLCGHSERRALVLGLLRTPADEPVRAFKNTRMCDDCHLSIKMISKRSGRIIMVRDASRFHVIVNGTCSCADYW